MCIQEQQDHNDRTLEDLNLHYRSTLPENAKMNPRFRICLIMKEVMFTYIELGTCDMHLVARMRISLLKNGSSP